MKIRSKLSGGKENLTSGIPFSPGADVVFSLQLSDPMNVYLTITGYLSDL